MILFWLSTLSNKFLKRRNVEQLLRRSYNTNRSFTQFLYTAISSYNFQTKTLRDNNMYNSRKTFLDSCISSYSPMKILRESYRFAYKTTRTDYYTKSLFYDIRLTYVCRESSSCAVDLCRRSERRLRSRRNDSRSDFLNDFRRDIVLSPTPLISAARHSPPPIYIYRYNYIKVWNQWKVNSTQASIFLYFPKIHKITNEYNIRAGCHKGHRPIKLATWATNNIIINNY